MKRKYNLIFSFIIIFVLCLFGLVIGLELPEKLRNYHAWLQFLISSVISAAIAGIIIGILSIVCPTKNPEDIVDDQE